MRQADEHQTGEAPGVPEAICRGTVVGVSGEKVLVQLDSNEQCSACASKGSCHLASQSGSQIEVEARGFAKGERVAVHTGQNTVLKVSTVLYLIPVLLIITGSLAGAVALPAFLGLSADLGSLIGVVTGIVMSLLFVHFYRTSPRGGAQQIWLEKVEDDE